MKPLLITILIAYTSIYAQLYAMEGTPEIYQRIHAPVVTITAEVTAYSELDSCHYPNCEMASTKRAYVGAIACPRNMELGARVIIDNRHFICEDRTNKDLDGRFDIFMGYGQESLTKAENFGIQELQVTLK